MHPRNRYRQGYDFDALARIEPELQPLLITKPDGNTSLDFTKPEAVRLLNKALLRRDYGLEFWDVPAGNLVPGVPGRLDYVHVIADLLADLPGGAPKHVRGLDIGTGASVVYPILGVGEYGWRFVASDIDAAALRAAGAIVEFNRKLKGRIELRRQGNPQHIFRGVVSPNDRFAFSMCNPPFFESAAAAEASARLKWRKLKGSDSATLNFGGQANELWTEGGEPAFLRRMIQESVGFRQNIGWFSTLVSQRGYLKLAEQVFRKVKPKRKRVIDIDAGAKARRVLAWGW